MPCKAVVHLSKACCLRKAGGVDTNGVRWRESALQQDAQSERAQPGLCDQTLSAQSRGGRCTGLFAPRGNNHRCRVKGASHLQNHGVRQQIALLHNALCLQFTAGLSGDQDGGTQSNAFEADCTQHCRRRPTLMPYGVCLLISMRTRSPAAMCGTPKQSATLEL